MLKKFFYGMMAATMLVATSCADDPMVDPAGETSTVSFSISTPEIATRTFNDGTKATQLQYAVYDAFYCFRQCCQDMPLRCLNFHK